MSDMLTVEARRFGGTGEVRDFFEEHGWVSIRSGVDAAELDLVVAEITEVLNHDGKFPSLDVANLHLDATDRKRLYDLHMAANKLHSLRRVNASFADLL